MGQLSVPSHLSWPASGLPAPSTGVFSRPLDSVPRSRVYLVRGGEGDGRNDHRSAGPGGSGQCGDRPLLRAPRSASSSSPAALRVQGVPCFDGPGPALRQDGAGSWIFPQGDQGAPVPAHPAGSRLRRRSRARRPEDARDRPEDTDAPGDEEGVGAVDGRLLGTGADLGVSDPGKPGGGRGALMRDLDLIYEHDCPNAGQARTNLRRALEMAGRPPRWREWSRTDAQTPEHLRRFGSPTILVDRRDVAGGEPL